MKIKELIGFLSTKWFSVSNNLIATSNYGISDLMKDQAGKKADTKVMEIGTSFISDVFGFIITVGVYGLILGQFLMTACDLLFITTPFMRGLLVSNNAVSKGKLGDGSSNAHLLGHYSGWDELRDKRLAEANMYAQQGNMAMAESKLRWAQSAQNESNKSDARRAAINEGILASKGRNQGNQGSQGSVGFSFDWSNRCFISNDLQALFKSGTHINLKSYLKKRVFSIILVVMFIMMVIASNTFINTGMNVGKGILTMLGLG